MKLLSIDVGIKNLAYCFMENVNATEVQIMQWDVINLCGSAPVCSAADCQMKAGYSTPDKTTHFCKKHAKKSTFHLPHADWRPRDINKLNGAELLQIEAELALPKTLEESSNSKTGNKLLAAKINAYLQEKMLLEQKAPAANDLNLIQIGTAMLAALDKEILPFLAEVDEIIIENQISPLAMRMKSLQGMLTQYFIMRGHTAIRFVSSANKLKGITVEKAAEKTTYAERKKAGITYTLTKLQGSTWLERFSVHKKQDDLADAFLQGVAYLSGK
jgi:hypothetical protein